MENLSFSLTPAQQLALDALELRSITSSIGERLTKIYNSLVKKGLVTSEFCEDSETYEFSLKKESKKKTSCPAPKELLEEAKIKEQDEIKMAKIREMEDDLGVDLEDGDFENIEQVAVEVKVALKISVKKGDTIRTKCGSIGKITKYSSNKDITIEGENNFTKQITKEDILELC